MKIDPTIGWIAIPMLAATVGGCWIFYRIGRNIGWLRPFIGLLRR